MELVDPIDDSDRLQDDAMLWARGFYKIMEDTNIPRSALFDYDNCNPLPADASAENPLPSLYLVKKCFEEVSDVTFTRHHSCPRGCMMYCDDETTTCAYCPAARLAAPENPASYVDNLSIREYMAGKLHQATTRNQLLYRHQRSNDSGNADDILDGDVYKLLVNDGLFSSQYDIAIGLSIDGFTPLDKSSFQATMVNMTVYNLRPMISTLSPTTIMIISGTNKPRDLESFLQPVFTESMQLTSGWLDVVLDNRQEIHAKVHFLTFTGDIPAVADLIHHSGHMSKWGCRVYLVRGAHSGGMYFHGMASKFPIRQVASFQHTLRHSNDDKNAELYCDFMIIE
ncbi:hypothetical protein [Absidia glauca]|uniref:Uncharacterized protein n=1 Tax=Absidia glauca TaxID=4829 RepID=A0A168MU78_ABSGL|nr:hypothetical protein [Absidia glauca]